MSERIVARVMGARTAEDERAPFARLSDREWELFALIGRGLRTSDVAEQHDLSTKPSQHTKPASKRSST
jgi:DNA-binding NarL/FixJ family response regulator